MIWCIDVVNFFFPVRYRCFYFCLLSINIYCYCFEHKVEKSNEFIQLWQWKREIIDICQVWFPSIFILFFIFFFFILFCCFPSKHSMLQKANFMLQFIFILFFYFSHPSFDFSWNIQSSYVYTLDDNNNNIFYARKYKYKYIERTANIQQSNIQHEEE